MIDALRSFWVEPAPPAKAGPSRVDAGLALAGLGLVVVELLTRESLVWKPAALAFAVVLAGALWQRRPRPFLALLLSLGVSLALDVAAFLADVAWDGVYSGALLLLLPYSLLRWGEGRHGLVGLLLMAALYAGTIARGEVADLEEGIGGALVFFFPAALGALVRFRSAAHREQLAQARANERAHLARDLHDTVAHHVSAIAVQAQAGAAVFERNPAQAARVLAVIEDEARRTLAEMRAIVGALRDDPSAETTPHRIEDLASLAAAPADGAGPKLTFSLDGDAAAVSPSVHAAVLRLGQESLTNARKHAVLATSVHVEVTVTDDEVRLVVTDDGRGPARLRDGGFGLVGMRERAALLGGTFAAGPLDGGGWRVDVTLPRGGAFSTGGFPSPSASS